MRFLATLACAVGLHDWEPVMTTRGGTILLFRCYRVHSNGLNCLAEKYEVL